MGSVIVRVQCWLKAETWRKFRRWRNVMWQFWRKWVEIPVTFLVAILVGLGVIGTFVNYYQNKEVPSPFEFSVLSVTFGGFLMLFEKKETGEVKKAGGKVVAAAKLFWIAALSFITLMLLVPMVKSSGNDRWPEIVVSVLMSVALTVAVVSFASACGLMVLIIGHLNSDVRDRL